MFGSKLLHAQLIGRGLFTSLFLGIHVVIVSFIETDTFTYFCIYNETECTNTFMQ